MKNRLTILLYDFVRFVLSRLKGLLTFAYHLERICYVVHFNYLVIYHTYTCKLYLLWLNRSYFYYGTVYFCCSFSSSLEDTSLWWKRFEWHISLHHAVFETAWWKIPYHLLDCLVTWMEFKQKRSMTEADSELFQDEANCGTPNMILIALY